MVVSYRIVSLFKIFSVFCLFIHPCPPQHLTTTDPFVIYKDLPSPECHIVETTHSLYSWFNLLLNAFKFPLFFLWLDSSFVFRTENYSIVWV